MNKKGKILTAIALASFAFAGCTIAAGYYAREYLLKLGCRNIYLDSLHKPLTGRIDIDGKRYTFLTKAKEGKLELTIQGDGDDGVRFVDEGHDGTLEKVFYLGLKGEQGKSPVNHTRLYRNTIFSIHAKIYEKQSRKLRKSTPTYEA